MLLVSAASLQHAGYQKLLRYMGKKPFARGQLSYLERTLEKFFGSKKIKASNSFIDTKKIDEWNRENIRGGE